MKKKDFDPSGYRTEEMLKAEARERAAEQARLDAERPPAPPRRKKAENFWYHYKWHTLAAGLALVLAVFFLKDMVLRTEPDLTLVLAVSTPVSQDALDALQTALEEQVWDFNGDGKVSVLLDYIYLPAEADEEPAEGQISTGQLDYASVMKLTTVAAAGMDPLYLLDDSLYAYLERMAAPAEDDEAEDAPPPEEGPSLFLALSFAGAEEDRLPFSATVLSGAEGCEAFTGTAFSLRAKQDKKTADYHANCLELLELLAG